MKNSQPLTPVAGRSRVPLIAAAVGGVATFVLICVLSNPAPAPPPQASGGKPSPAKRLVAHAPPVNLSAATAPAAPVAPALPAAPPVPAATPTAATPAPAAPRQPSVVVAPPIVLPKAGPPPAPAAARPEANDPAGARPAAAVSPPAPAAEPAKAPAKISIAQVPLAQPRPAQAVLAPPAVAQALPAAAPTPAPAAGEAAAAKLGDGLTPVRPRGALLLVPAVSAQPWAVDAPAKQATPRVPMPPADVAPKAREMKSDRVSLHRTRPALDLPPLAAAGEVTPPARAGLDRPLLAAGPLARAAAPDAATAPVLAAPNRPPFSPPALTDDPTFEPARATTLALVPAPRDVPAPFLRLSIPDPFELPDAVRLRTPAPDDDAPASSPAMPPKPVFVVK